jgi:hypothetical protein
LAEGLQHDQGLVTPRILSNNAWISLPTCDTQNVLQDRRQNSQTTRKGSYQREMTDPAISQHLDNSAIVANLCCRLISTAWYCVVTGAEVVRQID